MTLTTTTRIAAAMLVAVALAAFAARAQDTPKPSGQAAAPQANESDNPAPGLGEIMSLQQMRHIKLWFAGQAGNWPLADYEIGELNEGFEDVTKLLGGDLVEKAVGQQIAALQKAIDGKNSAAFATAFDNLSAGCNGCHHTLDHGFIVIQRPTLLPYSDQIFPPQK
jgi:hypothetical protein